MQFDHFKKNFRMKKYLIGISLLLISTAGWSQNEKDRTKFFPQEKSYPKKLPTKKNTWVFIMAGQSNMAGRGWVEAQDTVPDKRIFAIDSDGKLLYAKEPLNLFEPSYAGLDCGVSFARSLLKEIQAKINVVVIHTAVGGSNIRQWIDDSSHRNVKLLSNFKDKVAIAKKYGTIKGIIWHQGEADANAKRIPLYEKNLGTLFTTFRSIVGNDKLPIIMGELGAFSKDPQGFEAINKIIRSYHQIDIYSSFIKTSDLMHKGDSLHFNSAGQRTMGERYAKLYSEKF
jgi:hypothetical protein